MGKRQIEPDKTSPKKRKKENEGYHWTEPCTYPLCEREGIYGYIDEFDQEEMNYYCKEHKLHIRIKGDGSAKNIACNSCLEEMNLIDWDSHRCSKK